MSRPRLVTTRLDSHWERFLVRGATEADVEAIAGKNMVWHRDREVLVAVARRAIVHHGWVHAKVAIEGLDGGPGPVLCLYAAEDRRDDLQGLFAWVKGLVGGWQWKTEAATEADNAAGRSPQQRLVQDTQRGIIIEDGGTLADLLLGLDAAARRAGGTPPFALVGAAVGRLERHPGHPMAGLPDGAADCLDREMTEWERDIERGDPHQEDDGWNRDPHDDLLGGRGWP